MRSIGSYRHAWLDLARVPPHDMGEHGRTSWDLTLQLAIGVSHPRRRSGITAVRSTVVSPFGEAAGMIQQDFQNIQDAIVGDPQATTHLNL